MAKGKNQYIYNAASTIVTCWELIWWSVLQIQNISSQFVAKNKKNKKMEKKKIQGKKIQTPAPKKVKFESF